jgi:hypothetical protein
VWALAPFATAIFALFSMLGPVGDLIGGAHQTYPALMRYSLISGLIAVGLRDRDTSAELCADRIRDRRADRLAGTRVPRHQYRAA